MTPRAKLAILVVILVSSGIGLILYKHYSLGFPLWPGEKQQVWTIEAKVEFLAYGDPVLISFALPDKPPHFINLKENFASAGYGFSQEQINGERRAKWTSRAASGKQTLFYRLDVYGKTGTNLKKSFDPATPLIPVELEEPYKTAALNLIADVQKRSVNAETFAAELIKSLNSPNLEQSVQLLLGENYSEHFKAQLSIDLLSLAKIPARIVRGLYLESGRRRQSLVSFIEVHEGDQWLLFNPVTGVQGIPKNFVIWQRGGQSLLDVTGGSQSVVHFSMIKNARASRDLALRYGEDTKAPLIDFSIYSLPIEEQNAFKYILLIPIGALIVVIMRILVGIRTSGTFMPILIALAFIQTTLITGVIIFLLVVGTGLIIRSYLSHLNLLLVARISSVIIVVAALMAAISIISQKLGLSQALTVTFFPMIILAWTIERMSILWEEDGPHEVLIQGSGSLIVAVLAYLCMTNPVVEYFTFNFPEMLLVNLGLIMVLGQYTGYRLSELRRFRTLMNQDVSR
ncbi:MAG: inactive transglutaminase family protein [Pseudomonadales bacterium]|nr:inactive transglutaminase family protein [Pseudomonadales bacterium]MCP5214091.1 inactive transglutaminase family protein [Pseudomonadales bacterium]